MRIEMIENISRRGRTNRIGNRRDKTCNCHVTPAHFFGSEAGSHDLTGGKVEHLTDANDDRRDHEHDEAIDDSIHEYAHCKYRSSNHHHQKRRTVTDAAADPKL